MIVIKKPIVFWNLTGNRKEIDVYNYYLQLLSRETEKETNQMTLTSAMANRYHPFANFDNLTFNCCEKCKGELTAVWLYIKGLEHSTMWSEISWTLFLWYSSLQHV